MLEFTYPPGSSDIPIAAWETKATLNLKDLPRHVSICSSVFLKSFAADAGAFFSFFEIVDEEGKRFAAMEYVAGSITESWVRVMLGRNNDKNEARIKAKKKLPIFFAQSWVRGCVTLEPSTALARSVVDGGRRSSKAEVLCHQDANQRHPPARHWSWNQLHQL